MRNGGTADHGLVVYHSYLGTQQLSCASISKFFFYIYNNDINKKQKETRIAGKLFTSTFSAFIYWPCKEADVRDKDLNQWSIAR